MDPYAPNHCNYTSSSLSSDIRKCAKGKFRGFCADLGAFVGTGMLTEVAASVSVGAHSGRKWPLLNAKETRLLHLNTEEGHSVVYLKGSNGRGMSLSTMRMELETIRR